MGRKSCHSKSCLMFMIRPLQQMLDALGGLYFSVIDEG